MYAGFSGSECDGADDGVQDEVQGIVNDGDVVERRVPRVGDVKSVLDVVAAVDRGGVGALLQLDCRVRRGDDAFNQIRKGDDGQVLGTIPSGGKSLIRIGARRQIRFNDREEPAAARC